MSDHDDARAARESRSGWTPRRGARDARDRPLRRGGARGRADRLRARHQRGAVLRHRPPHGRSRRAAARGPRRRSCSAAGTRARRWRSSRAATPAAPRAAEGQRPASAARWSASARKAATTRGSNCAPGAALELLDRDLGAHRLAVAAVGGHRLVGVADEHDPRGERDRLAGQLVGVALAVHALVGRAHDRGDALERRRGLQDALADDRVAAHELPLGVVERAGLVEDRVGDGDLAHVVQLRRLAQVLELLGQQAEPLADRDGELRHAVDVGPERGMALRQRAQQHVARLAPGRDAAAVLLQVHALVRDVEGVLGAGGLRRAADLAVGAGDREAVAVLAERLGGVREHHVDVAVLGRTRARRTRRRPSGRPRRGPRRTSRRALLRRIGGSRRRGGRRRRCRP